MNKIERIGTITTIVAIAFIIFGWIQTFGHEDNLRRTIRTYLFVSGGFLLIFIVVLLQLIYKYINELEYKIAALTKEIKNK